MAKKKRRRARQRPLVPGPSGNGGSAASDRTSAVDPQPSSPPAEAIRAGRKGPPVRPRAALPRSRLSERMRQPSPYPSLASTLRRSALAVCGSPAVLVPSLGVLGATWLGLVAAGVVVFPILLVEALALPPIGTFFFDLFVPANVFGLTLPALGITLALTFLRAVLLSVLVGMLLEWFEFSTITWVGVLQGLRAFPAVLGIVVVNVAAIVGNQVVIGTILGPISQLLLIVIMFGGIYLLPMAPAAAVRKQLPPRDAIRVSVRAARLPGPRQMTLSIVYFFVALVLLFFEPGRGTVTANPPLTQWIWILAAGVIHLVFLAAYCERWLAVEDQVPTAPAPRQPASSRARR